MNESKPCKKTVTRRAKRPVPTIVLSLMCALAVIVSRSLTFPSAAQYRGLVFAYSDIFIVLASGIGGMGSGMLSFSLIFIAEFFRIDGNFSGLYTLSTYLILIIISARLAYDHFFCNIKKTVLSALFIAIALAFCWHLTFSMLFPEVLPTDPTNPQMFRNLSLLQLIPGAFAETLFASILIYLFLHKAPDSLKCELGSGWQYTKAYEERHHLGKKRQYVLGVRVTALSIGEALLLCIVAILFSDIQVAVSQNSKFCILLIAKLWKSNLQLGLTMICAAFPISYLFNMYVLKYVVFPINEMSFILERYFDGDSRCQDGFPDLQIHSRDEIEKLYHSLKKMTADLVDYLQTQKEKHRLEAEVQAAQRASKAKSDFLSSMSHEIRTPINAVLGLDEMILRESDNSTVRNYANDIQSSGKMLLSIVNDILDLSKIEAGKMEIIPTEYDTDVLVHDLVNMIAGRAQSKGLEFIVTIDEKLPVHLFGDDTRIKQCILNILTNAVKYTPSGSVTFSLSCEKKDDNHIMLTAQVVDTGIGIKKEDLQKLYAPFERIEEKRNKSIEGTGLGMSIVKRLLAAMNSQLIVKSDYGHGSDFSFTVEQ
ncbi:MAG: hypothetical protein IJ828_04080, partial [Treponema sp.]|nr:hypothetical protein [Treponema sp.]